MCADAKSRRRGLPPVAAIFVRFSGKNQQESGVAHRETRNVVLLSRIVEGADERSVQEWLMSASIGLWTEPIGGCGVRLRTFGRHKNAGTTGHGPVPTRCGLNCGAALEDAGPQEEGRQCPFDPNFSQRLPCPFSWLPLRSNQRLPTA
ncbi:hypothetical protein AB395_00001770 [Sinorhizobium fredii CCBAU 45436]|nr:hypothetical protein SF83666_c17290 [Sinorhizobium fredii CCBAU 83666]AWI57424.1 hypothetical protein AB395_00001770 [Sinorhizobium fredii CCBAU 45436]AWM25280.1 hypothetical protein AOX55_00002028 [Sinorhizobium fredii CCBAU 25509]